MQAKPSDKKKCFDCKNTRRYSEIPLSFFIVFFFFFFSFAVGNHPKSILYSFVAVNDKQEYFITFLELGIPACF